MLTKETRLQRIKTPCSSPNPNPRLSPKEVSVLSVTRVLWGLGWHTPLVAVP